MRWKTMRSLAFAAFVTLFWVIRSVVASGYLVYPIPSTGLPVDWKIPEHLVVDEINGIGAWARLPHLPWREAIGRNWIPQWLFRITDRPDTVAAFGLMSVTLIYFVLARKAFPRRTNTAIGSIGVILGIGLFSLIFWFLRAPDPRFLGAVYGSYLSVWLDLFSMEFCLKSKLGRRKFYFCSPGLPSFRAFQERACAHLSNEGQAGSIDYQAGSNKRHYRIRSVDLHTCPGRRRRMLGCSVTLHALFPAPIEAARQVVIRGLLPRRIRCLCSRFLITGS
jgi:hypothetical protein